MIIKKNIIIGKVAAKNTMETFYDIAIKKSLETIRQAREVTQLEEIKKEEAINYLNEVSEKLQEFIKLLAPYE